MKRNRNKLREIEVLKVIIKKIDDLYGLLKGVTKKKFFSDEDLQQLVVKNIREVGKQGLEISSLKRTYSSCFFWKSFHFFEKWDEHENVTWQIIKGFTHQGEHYNSLADHNNDLKIILEATLIEKKDISFVERIKLAKQRIKVNAQQTVHDEKIHNTTKAKVGGLKVIYTPMGNKG